MFDAPQIDHLLRQLGEHKWETRQIATIELIAMGESVVDRLLDIIVNDQPTIPHDYVRRHAVDILGKLKFTGAIELLMNATADENPLMREHSAIALGNIGDEASIPTLLNLLSNDLSFDVREGAAHALGRFQRPDVYKALVEALGDDEDFVRESASAALISIGSHSRDHVIEGLQNVNEIVRSECKYILSILDYDTYDKNRLWDGLRDESFSMRLLTVTKLWDLCKADMIPGLEIALNDPNRHIRLTAVLALRCIGNDKARQVIASAKSDEDATIRKIAKQVVDNLR